MTRSILSLLAACLTTSCVTAPAPAPEPPPRVPTRAEVLGGILEERTARASTDAERLEILLVKRGLAVGCNCDREIAELAQRLNYPGLERDALGRLTRAHPEERALWVRYAPLVAQTNSQEALTAYQALFKLSSSDDERLPVRYALIALYSELKMPAKRKPHVVALLEQTPNDLQLARLALEDASKGEREAALARVVRLDPKDQKAAIELAGLRADKRPDDALRLYHALSDPKASAAKKDLLATLKVPERPVQGRVQTVVRAIRRAVAPVYKDLAANKSGRVDVAFETNASGRVVTVNFVSDTLDIPRVRAAILGHLYRAKIRGGAKVHDFSMEFEHE